MDYTDFYNVRQALDQQTLRADICAPMSMEKQIAISQGREVVVSALELRITGGRHARDILEMPPWLNIVSQKFLDVLDKNNFTGWDSYPVKVHGGKNRSPIEFYRGLIVKGKSGPLDLNLSNPASRLPVVRGGTPSPVVYGLFFHLDTWDGSDVFSPASTGGSIIVSRRVKDALERENLSNVRITRLDLFDMQLSNGRESVGSPL